jgi:hypothetical protein
MQKDVCDEVLRRSLACQWDDLTSPPSTYAGEQVATSEQGRFDRESTPQTAHNLRMLDAIAEQDVEADESMAGTSTHSVSALFVGPLRIPAAISQSAIY